MKTWKVVKSKSIQLNKKKRRDILAKAMVATKSSHLPGKVFPKFNDSVLQSLGRQDFSSNLSFTYSPVRIQCTCKSRMGSEEKSNFSMDFESQKLNISLIKLIRSLKFINPRFCTSSVSFLTNFWGRQLEEGFCHEGQSFAQLNWSGSKYSP